MPAIVVTFLRDLLCPFTLHLTSTGPFAAVTCSAVLLSLSHRLWLKRTVSQHPHGWLRPNFSPLPPLSLFSNFGEMLPHACMTRRLYAYMLSQIRKTSTRVEQKFGGGDPPLVGDLAALFPQLYHYRVHPKAWRLRRA